MTGMGHHHNLPLLSHRDLPPLSSRPQGEILNQPRSNPRREKRDFSLALEMTKRGHHRNLPPGPRHNLAPLPRHNLAPLPRHNLPPLPRHNLPPPPQHNLPPLPRHNLPQLSHRDLPPLSSRPQGEISSSNHPPQGRTTSVTTTQDFSLRIEMTAGAASRPSPYREHREFSLTLEMT